MGRGGDGDDRDVDDKDSRIGRDPDHVDSWIDVLDAGIGLTPPPPFIVILDMLGIESIIIATAKLFLNANQWPISPSPLQ